MLLATMIAAALAGQVCPAPSSASGPPPCAAANVPGCLPGYHREVDAYGRARYVCDQQAYQQPDSPEMAQPPPPPPGAEPPPPPPTTRRYAGRGRYAPPWSQAAPQPRGQLGLLIMPGVSSVGGYPRDRTSALGVGLELRPQYGGARLRFAFEGSALGNAAEVAFKYDFFDPYPVRPFLAIGLGAGSIDPDPAWRFAASVAAGVDLYVTRDVFFTVEVKERAFARRASSVDYGVDPGGLRQTAFFMGIGLYL